MLGARLEVELGDLRLVLPAGVDQLAVEQLLEVAGGAVVVGDEEPGLVALDRPTERELEALGRLVLFLGRALEEVTRCGTELECFENRLVRVVGEPLGVGVDTDGRCRGTGWCRT